MENLPLCELCRLRPADKTGSHLIPLFLLKSIDTENNQRDSEIGFVIEEDETSGYLGRSVQPEKIDSLYEDLTPDKILEMKSPHILDNFLCTICEKRLSVVEDNYAKHYIKLTEKKKSIMQSGIGQIFWGSVAWRSSYLKGSYLLTGHREELRIYLANEIRKIDIHDSETITRLSPTKIFTYKVTYSHDFIKVHPGNFLWIPYMNNPYCFILGNYALSFTFASEMEGVISKEDFGFNDYFNLLNSNPSQDEETHTNVSIEDFYKSQLKINKFIARERFKRIKSIVNDTYKNHIKMNRDIPDNLLKAITHEIIFGECKLGDKYTVLRYEEITLKHLT